MRAVDIRSHGGPEEPILEMAFKRLSAEPDLSPAASRCACLRCMSPTITMNQL